MRLARMTGPLGAGGQAEVARDRVPVDAAGTSNRLPTHPRGGQRVDRLILDPGLHLPPDGLACGTRRSGCDRGGRDRELPHGRRMAPQRPLDEFTQVLDEMEAIWTAAGAPCRAPTASSPPRSRLTTSTPGWALSQRVSRAVGQDIHHRSRSTKMVPYRRRKAKSSTPNPRGVGPWGKRKARRRANTLSGVAARPSSQKTRAPASPPAAKPTTANPWSSRAVRRAYGATIPGSRSVKTRRAPAAWSQKHLPTCSTNRMAMPCQGRSAGWRLERECACVESCSQSGQRAVAAVVITVAVMAVASAVRPSRCQRVGSGRIVAGGTADLGKRGESARIVPRLPSTCPAWFTKITDEPPIRGNFTFWPSNTSDRVGGSRTAQSMRPRAR